MEGFPRGIRGYAPVELLGRSSTALVFKVRRHKTGEIAAVKLPHSDNDPGVYERFRRTARLWATLIHPHVTLL